MAIVEVGQEIYLKPLGNAARRSTGIITEQITKVGRKYFEVGWYGRFLLENMLHDAKGYTSNYKAYVNKQEISDEIERDSLFREISKHFDYSNNLTLSQLRHIKKVITP